MESSRTVTSIVTVVATCFLMCHSSPVQCKEYYITTSSSVETKSACPGDKICLSLSQLSTNVTEYVRDKHLALIFQAGNHHLKGPIPLKFTDVIGTLTMVADTNSSTSSVSVTCDNGASFRFLSNDNVYIRGLNFLGCNGNLIYSVDNFTVEDSSFVGGSELSDASLKIRYTSVSLVRTTFKGNKGGKMGTHNKMLGGAIYATKSKVNINESLFDGNSATTGGAVYVKDSRLIITNSTFINNIAECSLKRNLSQIHTLYYARGGALFIHRHVRDTVVQITNTSFINNSACDQGGAVFMVRFQTFVTFSNCRFFNNSARYGGALRWHAFRYGNFSISECVFSNNIATHMGAALDYTARFSKVIINSSTFINNIAAHSGGTISNNGRKSGYGNRLIITASIFKKNYARVSGGVLAIKGGTTWFAKSTVTGNRAESNAGAIYIVNGVLNISACHFESNTAESGGVILLFRGEINVEESYFKGNEVSRNGHGGVFHVNWSGKRMTIKHSVFTNNKAGFGGTMYVQHASVALSDVRVTDNWATTDGGVIHSTRAKIIINKSHFSRNRAEKNGGFMYTVRNKITIDNSTFQHNSAGNDGGVIRGYLSRMSISNDTFVHNSAEDEGGVIYVENSRINIRAQTVIANNTASIGSVMWADGGITRVSRVSMTNNFANGSTAHFLESRVRFSNVMLSSNVGSLCAVESKITIRDTKMIQMKSNLQKSVHKLNEGGAVTLFQSELTFHGASLVAQSEAPSGGAIHATESKVYANGKITIANNTAKETGGGIYLYQSELTCRSTGSLIVKENTANERGGGIHAIGSSMRLKARRVKSTKSAEFAIMNNKAKSGGGLYIEMDTKIYILRSRYVDTEKSKKQNFVVFKGNSADKGGAVYISDDGMCNLNTEEKECFFQLLGLYHKSAENEIKSSYRSIYFRNNSALESGHSIYGGLLDRCRLSPLADPHYKINMTYYPLKNYSAETKLVRGLSYLHSISNVQNSDIGSPPVRVCFCRNGQPDCSFQPDPVSVRRGQLTEIPISLAALDQINRPLDKSIIYNRLGSGDDLCQHHIQATDGKCTLITFTGSFNETEDLTLLTDGPCKEKMESQARMTINAECPTCPIGFQLLQGEEGCRCGCDSNLLPHISNCSFSSSSLIRDTNIWITLVNTTNISGAPQYLIHSYCPLDYCRSFISRVEINLNLPNGADAQCANNRSGLLCGSCRPGLSLSLGSSHCIQCPLHWPVNTAIIVVGALLAGVVVVVTILVLNLTVALGTINAIIFYSNVFAISFSNSSSPSFTTVLISWLNLEAGLNVCFFKGMDAFWKTLLQLSFPLYIVILVILIIVISEYFSKFSRLIGKRNPVATLGTLILLSYNISLNTVITSLSFTILDYPDDHHEIVWLADASVAYLRGKHIVLFIAALVILVIGIVYTLVLFFWQWILQHQDLVVLRWTRHHKLCHFIEPYHAPYSVKHRYWTGLLLLSRVILALVSAVNTSGDPRVTLVAVFFVIGCLLLAKGVIANRVYKNGLIDVLETIVYFNILVTAALTWYALDTGKKQADLTCASVVVMFAHILGIAAFHVYKYTALIKIFKKTSLYKFIAENMQAKEIKQK